MHSLSCEQRAEHTLADCSCVRWQLQASSCMTHADSAEDFAFCRAAAPTTTTSAAPITTLSPCTTIVYAYIGATYHCSPSVPMAGGLLSPGAGFITSFAFSAYLPGTVVQAYVYQWEFGNPAGQPTGSPLYTSAQVTGTDSPTSGVSQYSFSSMIPTTSGTQYVLYLQYVSGSEGSVGLSTPYDKQPSTAGAVSYYTHFSLWLGDAQFGIALTYTFCSKPASAKLSNAYWGCVLQPPLMEKARQRLFASAAGTLTPGTA